ncbi:MAG: PQQ-binding-like beta-propeller repeat protein, partial [Bryobacteraceae bacterium]
MKAILRSLSFSFCALCFIASAQRSPSGSDWPNWRGPGRDGVSAEKNLPASWAPSGDNLAWRVPYGSRSGPIVLGDHVYLLNSTGKDATLQERVQCFHADTGKLLWEHKFNVYQSDVPPHRIGWSSPAGDLSTGNIYALGVGGVLLGLTWEGKLLWERSLAEDFGLVTTHGGRTVSPVIEGDLVIMSGVTSSWGANARASHRFMAFDKKTGETVWVNNPGGRPFDTTYAPPIAATINGTRLLIAGGSDGALHAMKPQTGEPVWSYTVSKRGLNTGALFYNNNAIVTHSEENLDSSEMGLIAAIDATAKGPLGKQHVKWAFKGFQGGYSSPILDGDRVLQADNGANLFAFDVNTGKELWRQNLGTIQKSSPVLADGKIYVGTENGKFFILRARQDKCEILDQDLLGTPEQPEPIIASPAVSRGRIYLASMDALYAIGKKANAPLPYT